jgi:hypothetical protein
VLLPKELLLTFLAPLFNRKPKKFSANGDTAIAAKTVGEKKISASLGERGDRTHSIARGRTQDPLLFKDAAS